MLLLLRKSLFSSGFPTKILYILDYLFCDCYMSNPSRISWCDEHKNIFKQIYMIKIRKVYWGVKAKLRTWKTSGLDVQLTRLTAHLLHSQAVYCFRLGWMSSVAHLDVAVKGDIPTRAGNLSPVSQVLSSFWRLTHSSTEYGSHIWLDF